MGKSENGLGMLDCLMYLRQMDKQAGLFTTILLLPDGSPIAPHVTFNLLSVHNRAAVLEGKGVMTVYDGWPARQHKTFYGALFRAILEHDKALSSAFWDQVDAQEG